MILQALKEYYDRKAADPDSGIAPEAWERKEIPFLVVLDKQGSFIQFEDTRTANGNINRARSFIVPSLGEAKGNGIKANLFWENIEYMFGIPATTGRNQKRIAAQHAEFIRKINALQGTCPALKIVNEFLGGLNPAIIQSHPLWNEVVEINQPLLLAIAGQGPVTNDPVLKRLIDASRSPKGKPGFCLVAGEEDTINTLEPPIKGVKDASPMGAHLVAVNNKVSASGNSGATPAFASFMKEQGANSPIGKRASFAYATALNHLLSKDSAQRIQVGDASTVFWSERKTDFESQFADFFSDPPKDNPDKLTAAVKALIESPRSGSLQNGEKSGCGFYVLGLAPNIARISIRFWIVGQLSEIKDKISAHFQDMTIVHAPNDSPYFSLKRLLRSTAPLEDDKNIPPNLEGDIMRAILEGLPYPATLMQSVIRRIKVEHEITHIRAALIKACINRNCRRKKKTQQEELAVSLDPNNMNIGYRLGRLFAALEKIQEEASPGLNATIRDRYYAAASSAPVTVFGRLMTLKNHHLSKLENIGWRVNLERLIAEIVDGIQDFPAHLSLDDQGRFAVGYYHQRQYKKEKQD